jgi:acetate---CoA ligase (ADP-forming)
LGRPTLSESESKQLLAAWGVASAREHRANSAEAAVEAAEQLGFPVALKNDSPDILHKTEAGVVRLNLHDADEVRAAYAEILANARAYLSALPFDEGAPGRPPARASVPEVGGGDRAGGNPSTPSPSMGEGRGGGEFGARSSNGQARITGVSVQEMVRDGVEVIVGVSCDPQLGPVLLFGSGGVMVEVYNDLALRRCPITRAEAQAMIAEVKGARLLSMPETVGKRVR